MSSFRALFLSHLGSNPFATHTICGTHFLLNPVLVLLCSTRFSLYRLSPPLCFVFALPFFPPREARRLPGLRQKKLVTGPAARFCRDSTIFAGPCCQKCLRSGLALLKAKPYSARSESTSATNTGSGGRRRLRDSPCFGAHFGHFPHCGSQFPSSLLGGSPSLRSPWPQRRSYAFRTAWL